MLVNISATSAKEKPSASSRRFARNAPSHSKAPSPVRLLAPTVLIELSISTQRWRHIAEKKAEQVDTLITEAIAVRALLQATLQQKCPKLVERGLALARTAQKFAAPNPRLAR